MKISFLDLKRQYTRIKPEIETAVKKVMESGIYIGGEEVVSLEKEMADYTGVKYAISISSGTDALLACLMAIGVKQGDEVITSPFTFIATAEVVSFLGAKPVFVDIEEQTFNIDPLQIEKNITEKTRCIIPVHLFGHMADMEKIMDVARRYGIPVIEDAAQAIGASLNGKKACAFGDAGCLSFFPSKNLGAFGDGGMVLTDNQEFASRIRIIKEHGSSRRYFHTTVGFNGRLDALQAAILRVKLRYLDRWAEMRRNNAFYYNQNLGKYVKIPVAKEGYGHVYNQYSICTKKRDELVDYLSKRGIPTAIYYPLPLHLQKVFMKEGYREGDFPVSERISRNIVSLPVFPELDEEEREYITESIISFFKK